MPIQPKNSSQAFASLSASLSVTVKSSAKSSARLTPLAKRRAILKAIPALGFMTVLPACQSYTPEQLAAKLLHGFHNLKVASNVGEYIARGKLLPITYSIESVVNRMLELLSLSPMELIKLNDVSIEERIAKLVVRDFETENVLHSHWLLSNTESYLYLLAYLLFKDAASA